MKSSSKRALLQTKLTAARLAAAHRIAARLAAPAANLAAAAPHVAEGVAAADFDDNNGRSTDDAFDSHGEQRSRQECTGGRRGCEPSLQCAHRRFSSCLEGKVMVKVSRTLAASTSSATSFVATPASTATAERRAVCTPRV